MKKVQLFRKGQIVPRRLGIVLTSNKKAQHHIIFGQDCTWDGRNLVSVGKAHKMIWIPSCGKKGWSTSKRGDGSRQHCGISIPLSVEMRTLEDGRGRLTKTVWVKA